VGGREEGSACDAVLRTIVRKPAGKWAVQQSQLNSERKSVPGKTYTL